MRPGGNRFSRSAARRRDGPEDAGGGVGGARNWLPKDILRDHGYVEHQWTGVRRRIIDSMRVHIGTESKLVEDAGRFTVQLWKERQS